MAHRHGRRTGGRRHGWKFGKPLSAGARAPLPRCLAPALLIALAVAACSSPPGQNPDKTQNFELFPPAPNSAIARLAPKNGSSVDGRVTFAQRGDKVTVVVIIFGLKPGPHSLYIHEGGNCSSPNAASAGPVWSVPNPARDGHRAGELPQLVAAAEDHAGLTADVRGLSVGGGGPTDVVGHSVVVHDGVDPDPKAEFGVRNGWVACGIIQRV